MTTENPVLEKRRQAVMKAIGEALATTDDYTIWYWSRRIPELHVQMRHAIEAPRTQDSVTNYNVFTSLGI